MKKLLLLILFLFTDTAIAEDTVLEVVKVNTRPECNQYRELVEKYDWNVDVAMAVMEAESGCNPEEVNWKDNHKVCMGSAGLFQIGCVHKSIEEMKDSHKNIEQAYKIYSKDKSWNPWGAFTDGRYLNFL